MGVWGRHHATDTLALPASHRATDTLFRGGAGEGFAPSPHYRAYLIVKAGSRGTPLHYTLHGLAVLLPVSTVTALSDWRTPISATAERPIENDEGALRCYRHPNNPTRLRCNRCDRPICTQCATATSVGLRCPECARGPRPVMYQTDTSILVPAIGGGIAAAVVIGVVWGMLNTAGLGRAGAVYNWGFWFSLVLGFGVAEAVSFLAKRRRGQTLQAVGIACVLLGFAISRVVIVARATGSLAFDQQFITRTLGTSQSLLLTLLFLALACVIAWRRFR